jgi:hypothetical protein
MSALGQKQTLDWRRLGTLECPLCARSRLRRATHQGRCKCVAGGSDYCCLVRITQEATRAADDRRYMEIAEFHPIWGKHRSGGMTLIVGEENRAVLRNDGNDLRSPACRRKGAGEMATILLIDREGE